MKLAVRKTKLSIAACMTMLVLVPSSRAATIIQHSGDTDPTTESPAWTLSSGGAGASGSGVTHLGESAWKMTDPQGGSDWALYTSALTLDNFSDPSGWTLEWRMAAENLKTTANDEAFIEVRNGANRQIIVLYANGLTAADGASLVIRNGPVLKSDIPTIGDRATGYHDFALDYDPNASLYRVYVDGSFVTDSNLTPGLFGLSTSATSVFWGGGGGDASDARDVDSYWAFVRLRTGLADSPPAVPGDFDSDGDVDGADFVAWQTHFPTASGATLADADADGDGDVDGADFVVWQTNFPFTPGSSVAAVPEPHSLILASIGVLIATAWRRRSRR